MSSVKRVAGRALPNERFLLALLVLYDVAANVGLSQARPCSLELKGKPALSRSLAAALREGFCSSAFLPESPYQEDSCPQAENGR